MTDDVTSHSLEDQFSGLPEVSDITSGGDYDKVDGEVVDKETTQIPGHLTQSQQCASIGMKRT